MTSPEIFSSLVEPIGFETTSIGKNALGFRFVLIFKNKTTGQENHSQNTIFVYARHSENIFDIVVYDNGGPRPIKHNGKEGLATKIKETQEIISVFTTIANLKKRREVVRDEITGIVLFS